MDLLQNLPDGLSSIVSRFIDRPILLVSGKTTEVMYMNQAALSTFKLDAGISGLYWPGVMGLLRMPSSTDLKPLWLLMGGSRLQDGPQRIEKIQYVDQEDGSEKYLEISLVKPSEGADLWGIIIYDRTDVERSLQARNDFVTMASHQLRTPLAGVKWNIELYMKRYSADLSAEQQHLLDNASESINRMNELIKALLQLSRIETGSLKLKPRYVEVHKLLQDIVQYQSQSAKRRDIKLVTSFHQDLPVIFLDSTLVGYVFDNLITNAIKYSREHSDVTIFLSRLQNMLLLQVTDSGIGIPHDHQRLIFEKFYRDANAMRHAPDGTGLGLHLCRIIAHRMGGDIWFESEEGKGTTFWFTIPLKNDTVVVDGRPSAEEVPRSGN